MTKAEVVSSIKASTGLKMSDIEQVIEAFFESITQAICQGEKVQFTGFGSFERIKRKGRTGRNPKTGEEIRIPDMFAPKFTPSSVLKKAVK